MMRKLKDLFRSKTPELITIHGAAVLAGVADKTVLAAMTKGHLRSGWTIDRGGRGDCVSLALNRRDVVAWIKMRKRTPERAEQPASTIH